jgi:hypothetical protein
VVSNPPPVVPATNPAPIPAPTSIPATTPPPAKIETPPVVPATNLALTNVTKTTVVVALPVAPAPAVTNPPAPVVVVTQTVSPPAAKLSPPVAVTNANTNAVLAKADVTDGSSKVYIYAGAGVLVLVVVATIVFRASRRPQTSLISRSMQDEPRQK